jgi:hypothetical protein
MDASIKQVLEAMPYLETSLLTLSWVFLCIILAEIGIDFFFRQNRDYRETAANVGVGIVHDFLSDRLANFGTYQSETEKAIYGLTKNIKTRNPIKINVIEYCRMVDDLKRSRTLKEGFLSLFGARSGKPQALEQLSGKD